MNNLLNSVVLAMMGYTPIKFSLPGAATLALGAAGGLATGYGVTVTRQELHNLNTEAINGRIGYFPTIITSVRLKIEQNHLVAWLCRDGSGGIRLQGA